MTKQCSVCKNPISGNYCSNCGQQITRKTARFFNLILDFIGNFFSVDKSFIGTSRKLLSDPKFIVNNFHQGNKRYYVSPGGFLLYGITLIAIHSIFFGAEIWSISFGFGIFSNQYGLLLFLIPFLTLCSYLTFIRQGFHISKHLISNTYNTIVFLFIFLIIDDIILTISKDLGSNLFMLLFFLFIFVWNSIVFSKKGKLGYHILNVLAQLLIFIGMFVLLYFLFQ